MNTHTFLTPRGHPATLWSRAGTSDLSVLGSTFDQVVGAGLVDEYRLADLRITGRFADIGAHIGGVAVAVLLDNPDATAVLVEPIPDNVEMIRRNLAANGLEDRATVIEAAVGTDAISFDFAGSEVARTNRYIGNLNLVETAGQRIEVRRVHLADLGPLDALKIDCEGGEWGLFAEAGITDVPFVFGEYHGDPGADGIRAIFGATHDVAFDDPSASTGNFRAVRR